MKNLTQREIKFRAWDVKLKKWNFSIEIDCFGNIQEYKFNGSAFYPKYQTDADFESENGRDRFILCQFTGLKDKNGVDIYEGDTVKLTIENVIEKVVYHQDRFRVTNYNGWHDRLWEYCAFEGIEVIGNIFENPEL